MPFTAWATRVLTGDTLPDKLCAPVESTPRERGPIPDSPGRPAGLALPPRGASARAAFPHAHTLHEPEARGRALHFFANHELLALELMALTLLRFPELPVAFRRGLVGVMEDEQRHLQGYLTRMAAVGVGFGDLPVNRYFWDALSHADPLGTVAGLSLTFEQANLDFASYYADAFRAVGDPETAAVLEGVLADEIRHVRHGLDWFDQWRPAGSTRWDAWVAALPAPLTPARAKGPHFFGRPRRAAGLDPETILRLRAFGASKGRPPAVWAFFPEVESDVAGLPPTATGNRVTRDLAPLLAFCAAADDVVLVPRAPTPAFRARLADAGFAVPEIVEGEPEQLAERQLGELRPWGWSPAVCAAFAVLGAPAWDPRLRLAYDKGWAVERLRERPELCAPAVVGHVCTRWEEIVAIATDAHVLKAPLGTAGRGMRRWNAPGAAEWARGVLADQGSLVVEPWLERVVDLSVQLDIDAEGAVRVHRWGRFLTDGRGRYRGAVLGDALRGESPELRRLLSQRGGVLEEMARHVGRALAGIGYAGPAGIDALVYEGPTGLALKPLVEINPRVTMGRIAREIDRRVRRDRVGLWTQVSRDEVRKAGFSGFPEWAEHVGAAHPVRTLGTPPLLVEGVLLTSDPACAEQLVTVLAVGASLPACRALLALDASPDIPPADATTPDPGASSSSR